LVGTKTSAAPPTFLTFRNPGYRTYFHYSESPRLAVLGLRRPCACDACIKRTWILSESALYCSDLTADPARLNPNRHSLSSPKTDLLILSTRTRDARFRPSLCNGLHTPRDSVSWTRVESHVLGGGARNDCSVPGGPVAGLSLNPDRRILEVPHAADFGAGATLTSFAPTATQQSRAGRETGPFDVAQALGPVKVATWAVCSCIRSRRIKFGRSTFHVHRMRGALDSV